MSVIGTTLKQPRVFAHDAVDLKDLPGCIWRGAKGFDFLTGDPNGNPGEGFVVGECYNTYNETAGGAGAVVTVTGVDNPAVGDITDVDICEDPCSNGTAYNIGDILTIIWQPDAGGTFTSGVNCTGLAQVDGIFSGEWGFGCPFTPIGTRFDIKEDELIPQEYNPLKAFRQKDIVKWNCGNEEPTSCDEETWGPGAALYIGRDLSQLNVVMESGNKALYRNIPAGTFMPISCFTVCSAATSGEEPEAITDPAEAQILVLF